MPASREDQVLVAWTIVVLAGLIAVELANWYVWRLHYGDGSDAPATGDEGEWFSIAVFFLPVIGFFVWCGGLVVVAGVLRLLEPRKPIGKRL